MSWFNKKEESEGTKTPEEKKDEQPTETQEQIMERLLAKTLSPFNDQFASLKTEIESLKVKPREPRPPEEIPSVLDDENAAFNSRLTPIVADNLETRAKLALMEVRSEYPNWKDFEPAITEQLKKESVVARANPEFIRNVADLIIGRAVKNGVRLDKTSKKFYLEDASQVVNSDTPEAQSDRDFENYAVEIPAGRDGRRRRITRKEFLEKQGISVKDAKAAMDKLQVIN